MLFPFPHIHPLFAVAVSVLAVVAVAFDLEAWVKAASVVTGVTVILLVLVGELDS